MALGDYNARELAGMARQAANLAVPVDLYRGDRPGREGAISDVAGTAWKVATDALRVLPQLSAADLQVCIAFGLDPFTYLAVKLEEGERIAIERQERIDRIAADEKYQRDMEAWGNAEIERQRKL